jgi:hypothetical protein
MLQTKAKPVMSSRSQKLPSCKYLTQELLLIGPSAVLSYLPPACIDHIWVEEHMYTVYTCLWTQELSHVKNDSALSAGLLRACIYVWLSLSNIHLQICSLVPRPIACITVDCNLFGFWFRTKKLACKGTNATRPVDVCQRSQRKEKNRRKATSAACLTTVAAYQCACCLRIYWPGALAVTSWFGICIQYICYRDKGDMKYDKT